MYCGYSSFSPIPFADRRYKDVHDQIEGEEKYEH
jgi:hypothetical protein